MRVPVEWLTDYVSLDSAITPETLAATLTAYDLKLEEIIRSEVSGPVVVGKVLSCEAEVHKNGKTIQWCSIDTGDSEPRGIVCGADNFGPGDFVVAALPGAELPGGFAISARKTYGHVSDGMICSARELGLGDDHEGILVLHQAGLQPGQDALELLGLLDVTLDLEVNPDRAYALSMRGVARDTALAFDIPFRDPANIDVPVQGDAYPVHVADPAACPVFVTRCVTGFDASRPTPQFIARRLTQAGMRPLGLAIDITNYVMLEIGQPIHGYDRTRLTGPIQVRRAQAGETITTLDDVTRELTAEDLLIADDSGPIGLAGVMGGASTELCATTTDIVIEAAHFDPVVIGRAARRHKLPSEASKRFERGVDPQVPKFAAQRVAELLVEFGGGSIEPGLTVTGAPPQPAQCRFPVDLASRVTGIDLEEYTVVEALRATGCEVALADGEMQVTSPSWRMDLTDPADFVEEVLRIVGYDQVPSELPRAPIGSGRTKAQQLRRRAGLTLAGQGLSEVKTFPFAGPADFDRLGLADQDPRRKQVLLANPLSAEQPGMATTLIPGLLRTIELNIGRGHRDIAIFEMGRTFVPVGEGIAPIFAVDRRPTAEQYRELNAALPDQPESIVAALHGDRDPAGWWGKGRKAQWADAIAIAHEIGHQFHLEFDVAQADYAPWHPGRCAVLRLGDEVVGHAGELHPDVAVQFGFLDRVALLELNLSSLIAAAPEQGTLSAFSTYPVAKEDLAFILDEDIPAEHVENALHNASPLIESVRLFDVYRGDQIAEGKKSLAYAIRLRAADRTLTESDLKTARTAAIEALAAMGAELRG